MCAGFYGNFIRTNYIAVCPERGFFDRGYFNNNSKRKTTLCTVLKLINRKVVVKQWEPKKNNDTRLA